jgi:hypothetical protein
LVVARRTVHLLSRTVERVGVNGVSVRVRFTVGRVYA